MVATEYRHRLDGSRCLDLPGVYFYDLLFPRVSRDKVPYLNETRLAKMPQRAERSGDVMLGGRPGRPAVWFVVNCSDLQPMTPCCPPEHLGSGMDGKGDGNATL